MQGICTNETCDRPSYCKGYCRRCYARFHRHGDPNVVLRKGPQQNAFWLTACEQVGWSRRTIQKLIRAEIIVGRDQALEWMKEYDSVSHVLDLAQTRLAIELYDRGVRTKDPDWKERAAVIASQIIPLTEPAKHFTSKESHAVG